MGATDGGGGGGESPLEEKINVSVRLRPLNGKEVAKNDVSDWECVSHNTIIYKNVNLSASERSMYPSAYTFDRVFSCDCSTRQVYQEGAKEVALSVVSGINSSIFAYGQTSSGKTFTMTGITEYTLADIFDYIQKHAEREFLLKFSAMEIYNESVRDLLSIDNTPLRLLDDPERGTIVEKLTEETLRDWNHVMELLSICEAQRQNGETSLNEASSRSHQIIRLTVESAAREFLGKGNSSTLLAAVNFVDLAGSERASQSLTAGARLKEGCHINRSLLTLGTVIRKLSKGRNGHIPFRDSKLTRILQSSLGGNARTAIICTMSPARSHVEQSRNTLLFASCAKEVCTNAQVNLVMSDKALVKHLQRELIRLESELKAPGSTYMTSHCAALLREKDLQIEKLEKEIKDLILQRDFAQAQVQELLRADADYGNSLTRLGSGDYPHLRVQRSPDSVNLMPETSIADPRSLENSIGTFGSTRYSHRHSDSCSEENYIQISELQETFMHSSPSPRLLISTSQVTLSDSCSGWEDVDARSTGTSDDLCKEVRCIETELSTKGYAEPDASSPIATIFVNMDNPYQESASLPLKEGGESLPLELKEAEESMLYMVDKDRVVKSSLEEDREVRGQSMKEEREIVSTPNNKDVELSYIYEPIIASPENQFSLDDVPEDLFSSRSFKLPKSRSCKPSLVISFPSSQSEKFENIENTPPNVTEKEFQGRPRSFPGKISTLDYNTDLETLSKKGLETSAGGVVNIEPEQQEMKSADEDINTLDTCIAEMNDLETIILDKQVADDLEMIILDKQVADSTEKETEVKPLAPLKSVKDVGLDPIEDYFRSPSVWCLEFKRLQREIIELWHACNVSLVHRTYFFLLFKGDPADSIYMEVELRRLSFLKSTFSRGNTNHAVEDSRTPTLASSIKALQREREMLSKQMQKKLSEQERESLYLRWGIGLSTKYRRYQLACQIWTKTDDMEHIADSAIVVAKVVGFNESEQAPKEMFGLNFPPRPPPKRSYSFKRSMIPLL